MPAEQPLGFSSESFVSARTAGEGPVSQTLIDLGFIAYLEPFSPVLNAVRTSPFGIEQRIFNQATMSRRTGPRVIFRTTHHLCSNWIPFDVTDCCPEMLFVQHAREWPRLPEMTAECVLHVESRGIVAVTPVECPPKGIFILGNSHEMHMIAHEAVSANPKPEPAAAFPQEFDIASTVSLIAEDIETSNAALSDM